jgi:hypothetical protein
VLDTLIDLNTFTTSVASLQGQVSQTLKEPWDTAVVNNVKCILLPKNISKIIEDNYLVNLYLYVLRQNGYEATIGTKDWSPKRKMDEKTEQFLRAFGIIILTDEIPDLPNNHGLVWKGIASSLKIYINGLEKVDSSLFKVMNATHPAIQVFGDVWGKGYPYEKRMLDVCINFIRNKKLTGDMTKLLLPKNNIAHEKGLNIAWSADLITPIEESLIQEILNIKRIPKLFDLDTSIAKSPAGCLLLSENIRNRQKMIKEVKDIIRTATSNRITAIYAPYKGKNRDKARKKPIKELLSDLEGTTEIKTFNPTVFTKFIGVTPFTILYPGSEEEWKKFDASKDQYVQACEAAGISKSTAIQVTQRVEQVVRLMKS